MSARAASATGESATISAGSDELHLTSPGAMLGTVAYMSLGRAGGIAKNTSAPNIKLRALTAFGSPTPELPNTAFDRSAAVVSC
jgi:hypothetical protein